MKKLNRLIDYQCLHKHQTDLYQDLSYAKFVPGILSLANINLMLELRTRGVEYLKYLTLVDTHIEALQRGYLRHESY